MSDFEILGVDPGASPDEIRKAFLKLSRQFHPDVSTDRASSAAAMANINAAYDRIQQGRPDMSDDAGRNEPRKPLRDALASYWRAYREDRTRNSSGPGTYHDEQAWIDASREQVSRDNENARTAARDQLHTAWRAENILKANARRSFAVIDMEKTMEQVASTRFDKEERDHRLRDYLERRADIIQEGFDWMPPRREDFEEELRVSGAGGMEDLFERYDRLESARDDQQSGEISRMILEDRFRLRDGIFPAGKPMEEFVHALAFAEQVVVIEDGLGRKRAGEIIEELDLSTPEDKISMVCTSVAKSEISDGPDDSGNSAEAGVAVSAVDALARTATQKRLFEKGRGVEVDHIDPVDISALKWISKIAEGEEEFVRGDDLWPDARQRLEVRMLHERGEELSLRREDRLAQLNAQAGALERLSGEGARRKQLFNRAEAVRSEPFGEQSARLSEDILKGKGRDEVLLRSAHEMRELTESWNAAAGKGREKSDHAFRWQLGNGGAGEYLVARAVSERLKGALNALMSKGEIGKEAYEAIDARFPQDQRSQMSTRDLGELTRAIDLATPNKSTWAAQKLDLACAHHGLSLLARVEKERWEKDTGKTVLASRNLSTGGHLRIENLSREERVQDLRVAVTQATSKALLLNPKPEHRKILEKAREDADSKTSMDLYSTAAASSTRKLLETGAVSHPASLRRISSACESIEMGVGQDERVISGICDEIQKELKVLPDDEAQSCTLKFLRQTNSDIAGSLRDVVGPRQKGPLRAIEMSTAKEASAGTRLREADALRRIAGLGSDAAFIQSRVAVEIARNASARQDMKTVEPRKTQGNSRSQASGWGITD